MSNSLIPTNTISLQFYNDKYDDQLKNYFLSDEHLKFTGLPIDNIEKCEL
jgi:hypothetical protein